MIRGSTQSFLDWRGIVLTFTWKQTPFVALLLAGAMASLDRATIEAARNLGAGRLRCLVEIVLPQVTRTLMVGLVLSFVTMLSVLSVPLMVAGSQPTMMTVDMAFRINSYSDYGTANALGRRLVSNHRGRGLALPPSQPRRGSGADVSVLLTLLVGALALVAGTIGGLIGFGSTIILMPTLVFAVGPLAAIPILTIAGLMANASRVVVWWREVDWKAALVYGAGAIPASALGARTLIALDPGSIQLALGVFFLAMIPLRRWLLASGFKLACWQLAVVGIGIGFLAGVVTTVGPINTPFFLAYGLIKGPFISTEALGSLLMGLSKASVFRTFGALPTELVAYGLVVGGAVTAGSWLAKRLMDHVTIAQFRYLMDGVLLIAGLAMIAGAVAS